MRQNWVWMPHPGHFICSRDCRFFLNTFVNGYIISTVGEYIPDSRSRDIIRESRGWATTLRGDDELADFIKRTGGGYDIGLGRKYETMVFKAKRSKHKCCLFEVGDHSEIDFKGYNDAGAAYKGHMQLCKKYDSRAISKKK